MIDEKFNTAKEKIYSEIRQAEARAEAIKFLEERDALLRMMCQEKLEVISGKLIHPLAKNSFQHQKENNEKIKCT